MRLDRDAGSLEKEVALTELGRASGCPSPAVVGADLSGELAGVPLTLSVYAEGEPLDAALAGAGDEDAS